MPNILHLIPTLEGGGAERQLSMLAPEQVRRGWNVHVGIRRRGIYEEVLQNSDVALHSLGDHRGINPMLLISIDALIKRVRPDVVHTWLPQMDIVGGIASLWNSVPWVVSERTSGLAYDAQRFGTWIRTFLARYASAVTANSSGGAVYWRAKLPMGPNVFQIPNAVDVVAIRDIVSVSNEYENSSHGAREILVVGRLAPVKALEIVIEAIRLLPDSCAIHVSIIGEGPLRDELEARIKATGLDDCISLLPYRTDWWKLLKSTSALVSMSRFEGQPNVVLETMASGCPLILSDIPAHREFLDEDSAMLVPPDNPDALAKAIISLLEDPMSARRRAQRASAYVDGLTVEKAVDAYSAIYIEVMIRARK